MDVTANDPDVYLRSTKSKYGSLKNMKMRLHLSNRNDILRPQ